MLRTGGGYVRDVFGCQTEYNLYPTFPPPPPRSLILHRDEHLEALRKRSFAAPEGEMEDKPLFVLYRLYEHILLDNNIGMRNEIEAFWWTQIPVADIPDPRDVDEPQRYVVLSCIPALLVESFNQRIEMGLRREAHSFMSQEEREAFAATPKVLETVPSWTGEVAPLEETLVVPHHMDGETQLEALDDQRASAPFREKNILLWHPHIHFI
ncbi:hypothetical protein K402DRAFT_411293 [Aulographum hederae CBS 113979]|uniref:Uncharacterized protein n=1 Tax=Aulographum hederae CBS 113979 TaxID=1176131 RepID=A0A6G1H711_9PEZI|nr:hypothetical protein K402DRAFT_411293 [Aulographum hederae CBS 113979]